MFILATQIPIVTGFLGVVLLGAFWLIYRLVRSIQKGRVYLVEVYRGEVVRSVTELPGEENRHAAPVHADKKGRESIGPSDSTQLFGEEEEPDVVMDQK